MHGIVGWPGAMIDACIHLPVMTLLKLHMQKHTNTHTVLSVQATVKVNGILEICTGML